MKEENKPKNKIWKWVLPIALLIAFALLVYTQRNQKEADKNAAQETKSSLIYIKEDDPDIRDYQAFVTESTDRMGLDHDYSSTALLKLIKATANAARFADENVDTRMEKIKIYAERITHNPKVDTHADDIRNAATALAETLAQIQQHGYPELANEAAKVKTAAENIDPKTLALQQKDAINSFFISAANLLGEMN